jgi:hypothetical protein
MLRVLIYVACFAVVVAPVVTQAQQTATAQISGIVQDPSGAGVPGAEVKITQTETQFTRTVISGSDGGYTAPNLPVGPYTMAVSAKGFSIYVQSGIVLQVSSNPVINPILRVGQMTETVQVTSEVTMTETHENSISQVIDQQRIVDLPLNGRQATQLILLSGGSAAAAPGGDVNTSKNYQSQSVTISVAGSQPNTTNYLMDGGDNNDAFSNVNKPFPFPDALQEFSVQTSALPARYGLHSGGVVNLVTKSGSNAFHGDAFEFLRNGAVNARNAFAPVHDALKRNQFGGVVGGPVIKDKLFFFGGYQGTRIKTEPTTTISIVPNQQMLSGDFSTVASSRCTQKPFTLTGFPNNQIPISRFNQSALNLLKYVPVSTDPCGTVQYGIPNNSDEDQFIGRADYNQSTKNSIFGRYFIADYRNPAIFDGKNALTTTKPGVAPRSQSVTLGDNYSFGPGTISSFHASFGRMRILRGPSSNLFSPQDVGINISQLIDHFIALDVTNFMTFGCGTCAPAKYVTNTYQVAEDVDLIRGSHQISAGINYIHLQLNALGNNASNGQFTFNGSNTGYGLADFLLGQPSNFTQSNPQRQNDRENYVSLYVQDAWRVNRRLSINAGLRWEPYFPQYDRYGRGSNFQLSDFLANKRSTVFSNGPAGETFHGDPGLPESNTFRHLNSFAPRVGLVLDRHGDGKETIRLSYGLFYDLPEIYYEVRMVSAPPFGNQVAVPNPAGGLTNPYQGFAGGNPFPQPFPPPKDVAFPTGGVWVNLPLHIKPTYMQQWNLSYQRQITANWLMSVSYLGNKTSHYWLGTEINPAVFVPGATTGNTNARRVLSRIDPVKGAPYATIAQTDDGSNASYNGLLTSVQHRFSHNFTALSNYTFSHCLNEGDVSGDLTGPQYQDPNNRRGSRGNCGYDRRHIFNNSIVVTSPKFSSHAVQAIAGNWQLSGILSIQSGAFWTVTSGRDNSLTGVNLDRPDLVGNYALDNRTFSNWFNAGAFRANAGGSFGNAGRDIVLGPKTINCDLGLMRQFPIHESIKLEFRAEAFNVINHPNLDTTVTSSFHLSLSDPKIGQITGAADPRILQFALKLHF